MITSQILKFMDFTETQKSWEQNSIFPLYKKFINYTLHIKGYFTVKNTFIVEVTYFLSIAALCLFPYSFLGKAL